MLHKEEAPHKITVTWQCCALQKGAKDQIKTLSRTPTHQNIISTTRPKPNLDVDAVKTGR
jgi:hypothetical protein